MGHIMNNSQLFSRRVDAAVDFRPDPAPSSPFAQMRRLKAHLEANIPPADDLTDCPEALDYLREYTYRKIFTGTSHEQFVELDRTSPEAIDWLIAVHEAESANHRSRKQ
jgi:hypothetical protein